ncbi:MAG: formimidoylglutamase [Xanthomonadales bacterium]|jgi:formiminoglutamase|nr:formimidoylglutamase [Xanthomonadales bacterium]
MVWQAVDPALWQGRDDTAEGVLARRWHQQVLIREADAPLPSGGGHALLGFASDAGVRRNGGRPGAVEGPTELRRMLANLAWHHTRVLDAGDVRVVDDALEVAQAEFGTQVASLLGAGLMPIGLGGGHEIAFASWQGLAADLSRRSLHPPRVGILNLDAHLDLRSAAAPHSGTPFRDIAMDCERRGWDFRYACFGVAEAANTGALYAEAARLGVWIEHDGELTPERCTGLLARLHEWLVPLDAVYLTLCLDAFPAAAAPGVSAPAALGIDPRIALAIIRLLRDSRRLKVADVAELCPALDIDRRTARLAARLVWELARD